MADSIVSDKLSNKINYKINTTSNSFFSFAMQFSRSVRPNKEVKKQKSEKNIRY